MILEKMRELGFNEKQINTILTNYSVVKMRKGKLNQLVSEMLDYLRNYGYSEEAIFKISKSHPQIYGYSANNIDKKISFLANLGYDKMEIIKMTRNCPQIFSITTDNMFDKIEMLKSLGYQINQILYMISRFPQILTLSNKYLLDKFNDLISLGYDNLQVINITIKLPQIWSMKIDSIKEKKEFYESIGISNFIFVKANLLMQSVELSYARYMFYNEIGKQIDSDNYMALFCSQNQFKNKYGRTNEQLVSAYPYNREKKKKRINK